MKGLTETQKAFVKSDRRIVVWVAERRAGKTYGALMAMINAAINENKFRGVFVTPDINYVKIMAAQLPSVEYIYQGHSYIELGVAGSSLIHLIRNRPDTLKEQLSGRMISWLHFDEFYPLPEEKHFDDHGKEYWTSATFPPPIHAGRYSYATSHLDDNPIPDGSLIIGQ